MRSPFPGMDPFVEAQEWEDFHATFNTVMREQLSPGLKPRYLVRIERRASVEQPVDRGKLSLDYGATLDPSLPKASVQLIEVLARKNGRDSG